METIHFDSPTVGVKEFHKKILVYLITTIFCLNNFIIELLLNGYYYYFILNIIILYIILLLNGLIYIVKQIKPLPFVTNVPKSEYIAT